MFFHFAFKVLKRKVATLSFKYTQLDGKCAVRVQLHHSLLWRQRMLPSHSLQRTHALLHHCTSGHTTWAPCTALVLRVMYLDPTTTSWLLKQHTDHTDVEGIPTTCLHVVPAWEPATAAVDDKVKRPQCNPSSGLPSSQAVHWQLLSPFHSLREESSPHDTNSSPEVPGSRETLKDDS